MTAKLVLLVSFSLCAGIACAGPDAAVQPTPSTVTTPASDVSPLLDAWASAVGGRERLAGVAVVAVAGTIKLGGLEGPYHLWESGRGERREEIDLGPAGRDVDVFDGTRGWTVDRNHHVRDLDGPEIEDELALAYLGAEAALLPDRRAGKVTRVDAATLRLEPAGGRALTVAFDPATHLPATITRHDAEKTRVVTLADWRPVAGVRTPFTITDEDGDPRDTRVIHVERAMLTDWKEVASAPPFTRPADGPPDWHFTAGNRVTLPLEIQHGLIVVQVGVNGSAPQAFILDTGAEVTVINTSRLAKLGLKSLGSLAVGAGGGDVEMSYIDGVSLAVPGLTVGPQVVTAVPLDPMEPLFGHPIDGVLGYDFLSRFVVEVDYEKKTLTLTDPAGYQHTGDGEAIPITLAGSTPNASASILLMERAPVTAQFVVDTGCSCEVSFNAPFARSQKLLEGVAHVFTPPAGSSRGAGGETHEVMAHIEGLTLGHQTVKRPIADFPTDTVGAMADPDSAGLLGGELWRRFVVTFEYTHKTMWLAPNRHFSAGSPAIGTGIVLTTSGEGQHQITVMGIVPGTPGAEAGLAVGDVLNKLDQTPSAKLSLDDIEKTLREPKPHTLVIRRGNKELRLTVTARELF